MVFGGLGIGNLRLLNEPLLAKWLWHFFIEPHVDVVYDLVVSLRLETKTSRLLALGFCLFSKFVTCFVGDGSNTLL